MKVLCVGDCGIDLYLPAREQRAGGITLNFAIAARECFSRNADISIVAPLGDDAGALLVRERLAGVDVTTDFRLMPGQTPVQEIEVDTMGERHFVGYHAGVLADYRADTRLMAALAAAEMVVTPVFQQNRAMFLSIISAGYLGFCAVDFADFAEHPDFALLESVVARLDVGFFGLRSGQTDIIARLRELAETCAATFVVTLGAQGSLAIRGSETATCAAADVAKVLDTTGAGDAFAAGFLCRYSRTQDMEFALECGTRMAARALGRQGGN